jgi:hypothetical protein
VKALIDPAMFVVPVAVQLRDHGFRVSANRAFSINATAALYSVSVGPSERHSLIAPAQILPAWFQSITPSASKVLMIDLER